MFDVQLGAVKVPDEAVVKAHVGDDDEIFEEGEHRVDARLAVGVVAPKTVHRARERQQVPTRDQRLSPNESLLVGILRFEDGQPTDCYVKQLMKDGTQDEKCEAHLMDEVPFAAGNVRKKDQGQVFHYHNHEGNFTEQRIGHMVQGVELLGEIVL